MKEICKACPGTWCESHRVGRVMHTKVFSLEEQLIRDCLREKEITPKKEVVIIYRK
jgi:hypothetical protein